MKGKEKKGDKKGERRREGKGVRKRGGKGREERRKRKDDVIPNFPNLEALQLQIWNAAALLFCFM